MNNVAQRTTWLLLATLASLGLAAGGCPLPAGATDESQGLDANTPASVENHAPVADAGPDQIASAGEQVVLDGTGTRDEDHDELMYFWEQIDGEPEITLEDAFSSRPRFFVPEDLAAESQVTFRLTVVDGHAVSTDEVVVTLRPG